MYVHALVDMLLIIMGVAQHAQLAPIPAQTNYDVSVPMVKSLTQIISHAQLALPIRPQVVIKQLVYAFLVTLLLMGTVSKYQPARQIKY
jgi:hypothetical protein